MPSRTMDFPTSTTPSRICASKCEPVRILMRAGTKYALPIGWFGFGIHLREDFQKRRGEIESWPVVYHGTTPAAIPSILDERRIMFPGDLLKNGHRLPMRLGDVWGGEVASGKPVIYVSPTILYSGHQIYAKTFEVGGRQAQFVLQCRIKPGSYTPMPETLGQSRLKNHIDPEVRARASTGQFDPDFDNSIVEWVTADREAVVPYRLLVRWFD
eukprot:m.453693 g.453693  ORF g.453693 m.453693 type:complete len:213 (-) comp56940_c0_seq4:66-704(-)